MKYIYTCTGLHPRIFSVERRHAARFPRIFQACICDTGLQILPTGIKAENKMRRAPVKEMRHIGPDIIPKMRKYAIFQQNALCTANQPKLNFGVGLVLFFCGLTQKNFPSLCFFCANPQKRRFATNPKSE